MAPLSEHERNQLRLLEQQLQAEDPKFVKTMRTKRFPSVGNRRNQGRNFIINLVGIFVGIGLMVVGAIANNALIAFAGIILSSGCGSIMSISHNAPAKSKVRTKSAFMARLEYEWDERKRNETL